MSSEKLATFIEVWENWPSLSVIYLTESVQPNDKITTEYAYFSPKLVLTMGNIMNGSDTCAFKITFVTKVSLKEEAYVSLCPH